MDTTTVRRLTGIPLLLAATLTLAACSGGDSGASDSSGPASDEAAVAERGSANGAMSDSFAMTDPLKREAYAAETDEAVDGARPGVQTRAVISTGVVSLRGDDVEKARFEVQQIVDVHRGEIAEEKTQTDDDGDVSRSRLVIRVPAAAFDEAMEAIEGVAELRSSNRSSEDVTTQVIDNEVRIRAQTESLRRIEILLARAQSIRDIVAIEAQLTRRQADLDSLKSQQAWLTDQTSMSTITVFLETKPEKERADKEETGFLAGLAAGWHGLETLATGAATLLGVVLPFSILLLVLGGPAWLLLRRLVHRRHPPAVTEGTTE